MLAFVNLMNGKGSKPAEGMAFPVALVADQDEAAAGEGGWHSFLRFGKLVYNGEIYEYGTFYPHLTSGNEN